MPTDEKLKMRGNRGPTRPNPSQLAAGLTQNAQMANQMGNIYAGSRMTSGPTGRMFIPGQMPQAQQAQQYVRRGGNHPAPSNVERPWGEGKQWATQEQWANALHQANPNQFDWSRDDNTQEAYFNQLNQEKLNREAIGRSGGTYQTPAEIQQALDRFSTANAGKLDQSLSNIGNWNEQDYLNHGYSLQTNPLREQLGLQSQGFQNWERNPQQPAQPQINQPTIQPEGAPTQMAANNAAQQLASGFGGGGMQSANTTFSGKGGQQLPQYGKGNQQLPRP